MKKSVFFALALSGSVFAVPALAAVLTFDTVDGCLEPFDYLTGDPARDWFYHSEGGYSVRGLGGSCFGGFHDIHFDFAGDGTWHKSVSIQREDGGAFSLLGFDITSTFDYTDTSDPRIGNFVTRIGDNAVVEGYLAGVLTNQAPFTFLRGEASVSLSGFREVDQIIFREYFAGGAEFDYDELEAPYHYSIDNLEVVAADPSMPAVPVPPAITAMGLGLMLLGGLKSRRKG